MSTISELQGLLTTSEVHVDSKIGSSRDFTSAETILIGARKGTISGSKYIPEGDPPTQDNFTAIGVVQNASVAQNKQLAQIFEIGSRESYFVPGRTVVQAALGRVMVDGPSLMGVLYPPSTDEGLPVTNPPLNDAGYSVPGEDPAKRDWFFINLAARFFNNPLDLGFFFYDGENDPLGAFYLQEAYLQAHQITLGSQQTVVLENVSIRANKVISLSV